MFTPDFPWSANHAVWDRICVGTPFLAVAARLPACEAEPQEPTRTTNQNFSFSLLLPQITHTREVCCCCWRALKMDQGREGNSGSSDSNGSRSKSHTATNGSAAAAAALAASSEPRLVQATFPSPPQPQPSRFPLPSRHPGMYHNGTPHRALNGAAFPHSTVPHALSFMKAAAAAAATTTTAQPYPTSTGTSAMSTATAGAATVPPQRSPPASSTDAFAKESVYNPELRVCSICLGMGTTVQSTQPSTDNTGVLKCRLCGVQAHAKCYGYTCGG